METRLTADELGLDAETYAALLWVRDALDPRIPDVIPPEWMKFDMSRWGHHPTPEQMVGLECGTAYCIGGSMDLHRSGALTARTREESRRSSREFQDLLYSPASGSLKALFYHYPRRGTRDPEKAVAAIDQVLVGNTSDPWMVGSNYHGSARS